MPSTAIDVTRRQIISGSHDETIRIWPVRLVPIGTPTLWCPSFTLPITSGSFDNAIRIWDADTGAGFGDPLDGHTVSSVA